MRRYGLYDATRGLTTAAAASGAGVLLWAATLVGQQTDRRFWAAMAIVAAAGLVIALSQVIGGWTKGHGVRVSPGTFLLAFVPVLVCVGWILMATQPGTGWHEGTVASWSRSLGILGLVHALGLWHGVLAFGLGAVLGMSLDSLPVVDEVVERDAVVDRRRETVVDDTTSPTWRRRPADDAVVDDADEPVVAEREAAYDDEPRAVERSTTTTDRRL